MQKLDKATLQQLKNDLLKKRQQLSSDIQELKKDDPFSVPDNTRDNADIADDVQDDVEHANVEAQIMSLQDNLFLVELALQKMEQGTYGICENTGQQIPLERLRLVPEARTVV